MTVAQNIYNNPDFLARYAQLPRSLHGLDGAPEWPSLRRMLPPVAGARVLDLGCGFGWFCRWADEQGAASVLGIDLSQKMLERAAAEAQSTRIEYRCEDLDDLSSSLGPFELVYSSLALHYLDDIATLFNRVHDVLVPYGAFVFSVEHPIFTAPSQPMFTENDNGHRIWPLNSYFDEGKRTTHWLVDGVVKKHRTMATYLTSLLTAGLEIAHVEEWSPTDEQLASTPEWSDERHRPLFLLVATRRS